MLILMALLINTAMISAYEVRVNLLYRTIANGIHKVRGGYLYLRVVRRRGDDVVTIAAMRAPSNDDARFRAVGSPDVVTIAGNRLDIPDDRRHVQLLGRLVGICWHGWHGFRRGIASNLYELGANDNVVQRILRHAKTTRDQGTLYQGIRSGSFGCDEESRSVFGHAERLFSNSSASELSNCGKLLKARRGEVAERLNAAVC
jgi:hypothetical protein